MNGTSSIVEPCGAIMEPFDCILPDLPMTNIPLLIPSPPLLFSTTIIKQQVNIFWPRETKFRSVRLRDIRLGNVVHDPTIFKEWATEQRFMIVWKEENKITLAHGEQQDLPRVENVEHIYTDPISPENVDFLLFFHHAHAQWKEVDKCWSMAMAYHEFDLCNWDSILHEIQRMKDSYCSQTMAAALQLRGRKWYYSGMLMAHTVNKMMVPALIDFLWQLTQPQSRHMFLKVLQHLFSLNECWKEHDPQECQAWFKIYVDVLENGMVEKEFNLEVFIQPLTKKPIKSRIAGALQQACLQCILSHKNIT
jgi:hypothetical protein